MRPPFAASSTLTVPSSQLAKKRPCAESYARPREAAQPFGQSPTIPRVRTSITTDDLCQRCVNARPDPSSMTSDSGPLSTAIVPEDDDGWSYTGVPRWVAIVFAVVVGLGLLAGMIQALTHN